MLAKNSSPFETQETQQTTSHIYSENHLIVQKSGDTPPQISSNLATIHHPFASLDCDLLRRSPVLLSQLQCMAHSGPLPSRKTPLNTEIWSLFFAGGALLLKVACSELLKALGLAP